MSFTPNKNLQLPANGSFNNDWDVPTNQSLSTIDNAFGGTIQINVTGVAGPTVNLVLSQYQPLNIEFIGTLSANLLYLLPGGVGGMWTILNNTTGSFTLTFGIFSSGIVLAQNSRTLVMSDGVTTELADNSAATLAAAEAFATAADVVVTSNTEAYAASVAATAQANAEAFAQNGSNINSGTVTASALPLIGNLSGVNVEADPGGTPSGPAGTMWFYY
jgi:hypothetical protein